MKKIIEKAKILMLKQLEKNKALNKYLIELVVEKGIELSELYGVDKNLVIISLYLSHTVFDKDSIGVKQKNHPKLSSEFVERYLCEWGLEGDKKDLIIDVIDNHHNKDSNSLVAEIVRNAECFKFVSLKGALIWFYELGLRGKDIEDALLNVFMKIEQKRVLLSLKECISDAENEIEKIKDVFSEIKLNS